MLCVIPYMIQYFISLRRCDHTAWRYEIWDIRYEICCAEVWSHSISVTIHQLAPNFVAHALLHTAPLMLYMGGCIWYCMLYGRILRYEIWDMRYEIWDMRYAVWAHQNDWLYDEDSKFTWLKKTWQDVVNVSRLLWYVPFLTPTRCSWVQMRPRVWRNLDEIFAGVCDGVTMICCHIR